MKKKSGKNKNKKQVCPFTMLRRAGVGFLLASLGCLVGIALLRTGMGRAMLFEPFDGQPRDPIATPLFMGYDLEQRAMRELAGVAGGLQGAFSPASHTQLYQGLRGLVQPGLNGRGDFLKGPGGQVYEVEALPLTRRQGLADGLQPIGDDRYDDAQTRKALDSYRQELMANRGDEDNEITRKALESYRQGLAEQEQVPGELRNEALGALRVKHDLLTPSYASGDVDEDEVTRKALESYRQELAEPLPAAHALPVLDEAARVSREQGAMRTRKQASLGKVQRLYERLQNPRDRVSAATLVGEDESASALRSEVDRELPLQKNLADRMAKELRLTGLKMRDAQQERQLGEQELARYRAAVKKTETLEASNVHYLKAAHNYAVEARKEVLNAQQRDLSAAKVLAGAPAVLSQAHRAQVKARVTDNAAGLEAAGGVIDSEIRQVEAARAGEAAAAKERADADENAFVSRVINRVRLERYGGERPSAEALAQVNPSST